MKSYLFWDLTKLRYQSSLYEILQSYTVNLLYRSLYEIWQSYTVNLAIMGVDKATL